MFTRGDVDWDKPVLESFVDTAEVRLMFVGGLPGAELALTLGFNFMLPDEPITAYCFASDGPVDGDTPASSVFKKILQLEGGSFETRESIAGIYGLLFAHAVLAARLIKGGAVPSPDELPAEELDATAAAAAHDMLAEMGGDDHELTIFADLFLALGDAHSNTSLRRRS